MNILDAAFISSRRDAKMTTPAKDSIRLPPRTPAYVSRTIGAAELCISVSLWDSWVNKGQLPPPAPGFPHTAPRWRWADIDAYLSGMGASDNLNGANRCANNPDAKKNKTKVKSDERFFRRVSHGTGTTTIKRRKPS